MPGVFSDYFREIITADNNYEIYAGHERHEFGLGKWVSCFRLAVILVHHHHHWGKGNIATHCLDE